MKGVLAVEWRKSSRSGGGNDGNCVEVAFTGAEVAVGDSKNTGARSAFLAESRKRFLRR